jgi:hypothetical protein
MVDGRKMGMVFQDFKHRASRHTVANRQRQCGVGGIHPNKSNACLKTMLRCRENSL